MMKKKIVLYVVLASFFAAAMEIVSYMWRKDGFLEPRLQKQYYIGALLILIFGVLEIISLYGLKKQVSEMKGRRKRYWNDIVQFIFTMNCIGLPIYLAAFLLNKYWK